MAQDGNTNIPPPPSNVPSVLRSWMERVTEALLILRGLRGRDRDRALLVRDLDTTIQQGLARGQPVGGGVWPGGVMPPEPKERPPVPPVLENVSFSATVSNIFITWNDPSAEWGAKETNSTVVEIWRTPAQESEEDLTAFPDATSTGVYLHLTAPAFGVVTDSVSSGTWFRYWLRVVYTDLGLQGPWHDVGGTVVRSELRPADVLDLLNGKISSTELNETLNTEIGKIATLETTTGGHGSSIAALQTITDNHATSITQLNTTASTQSSQITTLQTTTSSHATSITQLNTTTDGHSTSIETLQQTDTDYGAEYSVKLDVDGYVSGFGLINEGAVEGSTAIFKVDRFAIGSPSYPDIFPFVVDAVNGVVAMDGAYIKKATITTAAIEDLAVDSAKIKDLAVSTAKIADLAVDSAKIKDAAITSAKINVAAIDTAHIKDLSVDTIKIKGNAVSVDKMQAGAVIRSRYDESTSGYYAAICEFIRDSALTSDYLCQVASTIWDAWANKPDRYTYSVDVFGYDSVGTQKEALNILNINTNRLQTQSNMVKHTVPANLNITKSRFVFRLYYEGTSNLLYEDETLTTETKARIFVTEVRKSA